MAVNACSPPENKDKKLPDGSVPGHMCPHLMMGHPQMLKAVQDDNLSPNYNYAVGGFDEGDLGQCYEMKFNDGIRKPLIVQTFNLGAQSGGKPNIDLYMPGGGFGAFNSCFNYEKPVAGQTQTGNFAYQKYPGEGKNATGGGIVTNEQMSHQGGIRGGPKGANNVRVLHSESDCDNLFWKTGAPGYDKDITSACKWVYRNNYHYNSNMGGSAIENPSAEHNDNTKVRPVKCPKNFTKITGLRRTEEQDADFPDVMTPAKDNEWKEVSTTTMEDCCKASATMASNVKISDKDYNAMYSCNARGEILMRTKQEEQDRDGFCCTYIDTKGKNLTLYDTCSNCPAGNRDKAAWCNTSSYPAVRKSNPNSENAKKFYSDDLKPRCIGFNN